MMNSGHWIRWSSTALFAVAGTLFLWGLTDLLWRAGITGMWWGIRIALGVMMLTLALLFFSAAQLCYRRQYRQLLGHFALLAALTVWTAGNKLLAVAEPYSSSEASIGEHAVRLVCVVGPLVAAVAVYRLCQRMAEARVGRAG